MIEFKKYLISSEVCANEEHFEAWVNEQRSKYSMFNILTVGQKITIDDYACHRVTAEVEK